MNRTSLFLALLFLVSGLIAQADRPVMDSLKQVLEATAEKDTAQITARHSLAHELRDTDPLAARQYLQRAISLSREMDQGYWLAECHRTLSIIQFLAGDQDSAMHNVNLSIRIFGELTDRRSREKHVAALINKGVYFHTLSDFEPAVLAYQEAREKALLVGQREYLGKILNNLGIVFKRLDRLDAAARTYREAIELKRASGDSLGLANTLHNLGLIELSLTGSDGALELFEEARKIYLALGETGQAASIDAGIGSAYYESNRFDEAMHTWEAALAEPQLALGRNDAIGLYLGLGDIYNKKLRYEEALVHLHNALDFCNPGTDAWMTNDIKRALGTAYLGVGDFENSANYFRSYSLGADTLVQLARLSLNQEMSEKYEAKLREAEIERQGLIIDSQQRGQQIQWGLIVGLSLLALGIFLLYRSRLRYQRSEARSKAIAREKEIVELRQQAELNGLRSMIEGQEAERHRVAKDLHDGLGGMLSSIKTRLSLGNGSVEQADKLLDVACKEVRRIAHNMVPQSLALSGLTGSLEDICANLQLEGLDCELEVSGHPELRLDEQAQSMLLRILQELTHNITKHARATHVFIQLLDQPNQLLLIVEDDGVGFHPDSAEKAAGLGMSSIRSRVAFLQGDLLYDSSPGKGTNVSLTIPL